MSTPVIITENLTKFYGKARGIEDINLQVEDGDIFGFIGPNGAGKSTTIRILLNLIFPTGGKVEIFGMNALKESKKIREQIGYIPSDAGFYDKMTVLEFLTYCLNFYKSSQSSERIHELAGVFGLEINRKLTDLSMGTKKKVSIVQSLIHNPRLLILDEPTTGLDPLMQSRFFDLLREENRKGMTIFFSSHVLSDVQNLCRKVAIIRDGRIINVEDVEILRKKQVRKITVTFREEQSAMDFSVPGMEQISRNPGKGVAFMYAGGIGHLVSELTKAGIDDLLIEEPTLEEIFMHYYR